MKPLNLLTSACRYCRFYQPEGRRGGICLSLGVSVQGNWKACTLAKPPFTQTWQGLEEMMKWSGRGGGDKERGGQGEIKMTGKQRDGEMTWVVEEERDLAKI